MPQTLDQTRASSVSIAEAPPNGRAGRTPQEERQHQEPILRDAAERLEGAPPQEILRWAIETYRPDVHLACSFGMQSVVIIDMLHKLGLLPQVKVFYLDTGVLFPETHNTRLRLQARYDFEAVRVAPEMSWEEQRKQYEGHLYERGPDGINQCCFIRKVAPMRKHLQDVGARAWITGMRRAHNATRESLPVALWDRANGLAKINPLAPMDNNTLWAYIKANNVPYNALYDQGYRSIGCNTPVCTRPVRDGEDERAGRWAGTGKTECGIHVDGNIIESMDSSKL